IRSYISLQLRRLVCTRIIPSSPSSGCMVFGQPGKIGAPRSRARGKKSWTISLRTKRHISQQCLVETTADGRDTTGAKRAGQSTWSLLVGGACDRVYASARFLPTTRRRRVRKGSTSPFRGEGGKVWNPSHRRHMAH